MVRVLRYNLIIGRGACSQGCTARGRCRVSGVSSMEVKVSGDLRRGLEGQANVIGCWSSVDLDFHRKYEDDAVEGKSLYKKM